MFLICTKCDRAEGQREGNEIHCRYCGNVAIDGVQPRWPFKEQEITKRDVPVTGQILPGARCSEGQSPLQLAESVRPKEADMGKKKCSVEGCEKQSWVDGLCHRHYTEMRGEYVPKRKYPPRTKHATKDPAPETRKTPAKTKAPKPETKLQKRRPAIPAGFPAGVLDGEAKPPSLEQGDVAVIVKFTGCDQLLEDLRALAKKEFRNIDAQILYIVDQYLKVPVLDGDAAAVPGRIEAVYVNNEERVAALWIDAFNRNVCGLRNVLESKSA
jgi:hypothetical protein